MSDMPKLLTEAEFREMRRMATADAEAFLRDRGLMSEPPDPLVYEARRLVIQDGTIRTVNQIEAIREGRAGEVKVNLALTALRRGLELAYRKQLTWEEVRDAYLASKGSGTEAGLITRLHAALTRETAHPAARMEEGGHG